MRRLNHQAFKGRPLAVSKGDDRHPCTIEGCTTEARHTMAKQSRATFQKREKEKIRQQKQQDKAQRRLAAKARRGTGVPAIEDDALESVSMHAGLPVVPTQWDDTHSTD